MLYRTVGGGWCIQIHAPFLPFIRKTPTPKAAVRPNQVIACLIPCLLCRTLLTYRTVADQSLCRPSSHQDLHVLTACPEAVPDELRPWTGTLPGVFCYRLLDTTLYLPLALDPLAWLKLPKGYGGRAAGRSATLAKKQKGHCLTVSTVARTKFHQVQCIVGSPIWLFSKRAG